MKPFSILSSILFLSSLASAAPAPIPFDAAHTVAHEGSSTPIDEFFINTSRPWLYLDLPSARGQYSSAYSRWYFADETAPRFTLSGGGLFTSDQQFWLSPSDEIWNEHAAIGDWRITASYTWWDLAMTYGVGAPLTRASGTQTIDFDVSVRVLPEPSTIGTLALIISTLCLSRRRR